MNSRFTGCFITLEGVEGVGKSSCVLPITRMLERRGIEVVATREPGGTAIAESIRKLLLWSEQETLDPVAELLLHFASRRQHLCEVIEPALERGAFVICDRFTDSTHAYQGGGRGLPEAWIDALSAMVHPHIEPQLTLFFDLAPEIGLQRITSREVDRYEGESLAFFQRVRQGYLARTRPQFKRIDAAQDQAQVQADALAVVEALLEARS